MSKIVCLFTIVALVQVATALECYSCEKDSCLADMSKWTKIQNCGNSVASTQTVGACLKEVYTEIGTKKEVTVRKCIIANKNEKGEVTHTCNDSLGTHSVCQVCTSNLCNSATSVNFSIVTLLGVVAVYLIPKLM